MYQLCFARDNVLHFTDNFENQWGDDWDGAPANCNAGEPYGYDEVMYGGKNCGHIRYIGFSGGCCDYESVNRYSVEEINRLRLPWLSSGWGRYMTVLKAGATMEEAEKFLQDCGAYYGELKKGGK